MITELHGQGLSYADIAAAAGLTRGRIHQLKQAAPAAESAFLGTSRVIIATPLKREAANARPVLAAEDFAGANRLAELARSYRLEPEFEHIPLGGAIDLNRQGLIVICGPKLSEGVASVLAQDPHFRFEKASDGPWTLHDLTTDQVHRAPLYSSTDAAPLLAPIPDAPTASPGTSPDSA